MPTFIHVEIADFQPKWEKEVKPIMGDPLLLTHVAGTVVIPLDGTAGPAEVFLRVKATNPDRVAVFYLLLTPAAVHPAGHAQYYFSQSLNMNVPRDYNLEVSIPRNSHKADISISAKQNP